MDQFEDRLSQRAHDTSRPALAHQSRGRSLNDAEQALAAALMEIYTDISHEHAEVAEALRTRHVKAPVSGRIDWDVALLEQELTAINESFDNAYQAHGYGA